MSSTIASSSSEGSSAIAGKLSAAGHATLSLESTQTSIFSVMEQLAELSRSFTTRYRNEAEPGFVNFLSDICAHLPSAMDGLHYARQRILQNLVPTMRDNPVVVLEHVDPSAPVQEPIVIGDGNGPKLTVPQVPHPSQAPEPTLKDGQPFSLSLSLESSSGTEVPYTITFIPDPPTDGSEPIPPQTWTVDSQLRDRLALEEKQKQTVSAADTSKGKGREDSSMPSTTSPDNEPSIGPVERHEPTAAQSALPKTPVKPTSASPSAEGSADNRTDIPVATRPAPPPPSKSRYSGEPTPANSPAARGVRSSNQLPQLPSPEESPEPEGPAPVRQGKPSGGGLKRAYTFLHKSHPEIFWDNRWGPKPPAGKSVPADEVLPPWYPELTTKQTRQYIVNGGPTTSVQIEDVDDTPTVEPTPEKPAHRRTTQAKVPTTTSLRRSKRLQTPAPEYADTMVDVNGASSSSSQARSIDERLALAVLRDIVKGKKRKANVLPADIQDEQQDFPVPVESSPAPRKRMRRTPALNNQATSENATKASRSALRRK